MIRKALASILRSYWEFIQKRPLLSLLFSLLMLAACAGAIYLIVIEFPTFLVLPCFRGGCG